MNKFCPACGTFGHDIYTNGCDFTAKLVKCLEFIKKHPQQLKNVVDLHYQYQSQRRKNLQRKGTTSNRFQLKARQKNLTYGPQVKLLMDVFGNTVDELLEDDVQDLPDDSIFDLIPDPPEEDNFQDTQESEE